jgi:penicillin-binding protein 1A
MADALDEAPDGTISQPSGIVTARIDPQSGLLAPAGFPGAIFEIFEEGHMPEPMRNDPGPVFSGSGATGAEDESLF